MINSNGYPKIMSMHIYPRNQYQMGNLLSSITILLIVKRIKKRKGSGKTALLGSLVYD